LHKLGLHLQSGAAVADVNKILKDNCDAGNVATGRFNGGVSSFYSLNA
jgi:hypothetical protein